MDSSSDHCPSAPPSYLESPSKTGTSLPDPRPLSLAAVPAKPASHAPPLECTSRMAWTASLDIDASPAVLLGQLGVQSRGAVRKTGVVCTIGPASRTVETLTALRRAGMNIVRLNMSHGTHADHAAVIENVRESERIDPEAAGHRPVAIALDTKGPEIRLGRVGKPEGFLSIVKGREYLVGCRAEWNGQCEEDHHLAIDYPTIGRTVHVGSRIYIDDGNLSLLVKEVQDEQTVLTEALNSHRLKPGKGVNLPYSRVDLPPISEKDEEDLRFAAKQSLDMVFASFVRRPEDVLHIKRLFREAGAPAIRVVAKIENHEGVANYDAILEAADGIMVARGDLGIEIPPEKVFVAQKMMIAKANIRGKPVICATQMLESMTGNPRPTRAEASDVANAVLDGADCVMLSAETASGAYPIASVEIMSRICLQAEATIAYMPLFEELRALQVPLCSELKEEFDMTETIACSAVNATLHAPSSLSAIIVLTTTGHSARLVAKYRPRVPIIVVTRHAPAARALHLHRGCYPFYFDQSAAPKAQSDEVLWQRDVDARFYWAMQRAIGQGLLQRGDRVVCIQGSKGGVGHTNTMRILIVP